MSSTQRSILTNHGVIQYESVTPDESNTEVRGT